MFHGVTISILLVLISVKSILACPKECSCSLGTKEHWQVECLEGGLNDPIPVLEMPSRTETLYVSASEGKTNSLTLGPIFRGLPNLKKLHVVHSQVPALGEHSFWGLKNLSVLNISYNSITALLPTNFRGPEALRGLYLSHNCIESVPSTVFRYTEKLQFLDMSYNRVPELVPKIFWGLSELKILDLSYNPLGDLPYDRFSDIPSLKEFRCIGCGLLKISESLFRELKNLQSLDFSNNRLTSVPPVKIAFKLSTLKLNGNHIDRIRKDDLQGSSLTEFHISHNRLSCMEEGAYENSSLKNVDLSYNRISFLKLQVLEPILSGLKVFDFSGNSLHIDHLKEILPKARQLRKLGIGDLGLTHLPPDLRLSRHLRSLNISSNYLSKFPHQLLYSTPHLQNLDLSINSFRGLSQDVVSAFSAMSFLKSVRLEKNPWQCEECHISYVMNWLKLSPKQPHSISSCEKNYSSVACLKCVGPEKYAGQPLVLLNEESIGECTLPAHSAWPGWDGTNDIAQADEPSLPINKEIFQNNTRLETVAAFFKDHLALLVGVACGLILSVMLVVVTGLACSKKQSAYYFTSEDIENREKLMVGNNNGSLVSGLTVQGTVDPTKVLPYEPMAISKVHSRSPIYAGNIKQSSTGTLSPNKQTIP